MKLNIIYGRSGTGKSTYIYNDIKSKLDLISNYNEKIFLIVPEQCNLSTERKLFEITGKNSLINVEDSCVENLMLQLLEVDFIKKLHNDKGLSLIPLRLLLHESLENKEKPKTLQKK